MRFTTKILNVAFGLIVLLFLLDCLPNLDIKSQLLKSFVYYGVLIATPLILIWNFFAIWLKSKKIVGIILPTIILIMILIIGPMKILFSTSTWHTQTILYQNMHLSNKTVELQMQDCGAFGYNRRTVEVLYLTPYFMFISEVPKDINNSTDWAKIDREINEMRLKQ